MSFDWLKRPASKLAVRIYLFGLIQVVVVIGGMIGLLKMEVRPPFPFRSAVNLMAETIGDVNGDPVALGRVLDRLHATLDVTLAVYDDSGRLVAHDPVAQAPAVLSDLEIAADLTAPVRLAFGKRGHLVFLLPPPVPPPPVLSRWFIFVTVVVGISSWFIARSLVRPLGRMAAAAHDLGAGKLATRLNLRRSDELGQVAVAFDRMAERVGQALRVEKELMANVSHELRTPLQRIHIAVELAAEGDAAMARESLGDIAEDLAELERIVDDVLTVTRLSLGEDFGGASTTASPPIRPEVLDVGILIQRSWERFRAAHPGRPLRTVIADDLPAVTLDGMLIRRVVDNLLDNAHKYTDDPQAEILLSVERGSTGVCIEVRDRGIGIGPEDLLQIFEPFFRADRSRTRATGGLGLGLALARRIVEAHGGRLSLESVAGEGTKARVELPLSFSSGTTVLEADQ